MTVIYFTEKHSLFYSFGHVFCTVMKAIVEDRGEVDVGVDDRDAEDGDSCGVCA